MSKTSRSSEEIIEELTQRIESLTEERDEHTKQWNIKRSKLHAAGKTKQEITEDEDKLKLKSMNKELTNLKTRRYYYRKKKDEQS